MEEYGIQKKTLDFVLKISVFGASLPPPHLVEFTPYVLQYRYEGDLLDSNGGQTRGAVLSFMEEYGIQKKPLDFVLKNSVFGARSHRL